MSTSFRPVREEWGEGSSCFLDSEDVEDLLLAIADKLAMPCSVETYSDNRAVFIEDGRKFLEYIHKTLTFEEAQGYSGSQEDDLDDLRSLFGNLKNLASSWLPSVDSHGQLRFYIDLC